MKPFRFFLAGVVFLLFSPYIVLGKDEAGTENQPIQVLEEPTPKPTSTPTPQPTPTPTPKPKPSASTGNSKYIVLHKPSVNPAWGKVIQYHTEPSPANHETLHVFLFQDEEGVVRTAVFHEDATGDGYWEILVWDR